MQYCWYNSDKAADRALGFVSVDLLPLTKGFPNISGFYNIIDFNGLCQGQIKVRDIILIHALIEIFNGLHNTDIRFCISIINLLYPELAAFFKVIFFVWQRMG